MGAKVWSTWSLEEREGLAAQTHDEALGVGMLVFPRLEYLEVESFQRLDSKRLFRKHLRVRERDFRGNGRG